MYGSYGNRRMQQGMISTSKGFTGQFTDFVAGLDYYGARYYDLVVGVFVSADVVQGNGSGMNLYGYAGGNPETLIDPSGEFSICIFGFCIGTPPPAPEPKLIPPQIFPPVDWSLPEVFPPIDWQPREVFPPAQIPPLVETKLPPETSIQITTVVEPYPNVVHNSGEEAQHPEEKPKEEPKGKIPKRNKRMIVLRNLDRKPTNSLKYSQL